MVDAPSLFWGYCDRPADAVVYRSMKTYENTKIKGNSAELEVFCFFNRRGYIVSLPFGENAPYDVVLESPSGKVYRVQIRWSSWNKEVLRVSLRRSSRGRSEPLDLKRIDAFVAWDGEKVFVVPVEHLKRCRAAFSLRRSPPKNSQKLGINLAADFEQAAQLLP